LPTERPEIGTLKKASTFSYIMGAWSFLAVVIVIVGIMTMMAPYIQMMSSSGYTGTFDATQLTDMLNAILLPIMAVAVITIPISLLFGYYTYRAGDVQGVGSIKVAGVSMMIVSVSAVPLIYSLYTLFQDIPNLIGLSSTDLYTTLMSSLTLMLLGAALAGIFGLVFFVAFLVGLSNMKNTTGIGDFGTAMWLVIISIFIGITFPIGILLFGSGLSKLARQGTERRATAPTVEEGAKAPVRRQLVYCPYCGAKVESDALFCPTCGSSLKKEV
jgi:hypothetical protein